MQEFRSQTSNRTLTSSKIRLGSKMKITSPVTRNSMLAIVLVCVLRSVCTDAKPTGEVTVMERRYNTWLKQHGKTYYSKDEWNMRFGIYQSNLKFINFVNAQNLSYTLTDNEFADMTSFEFQTTYLGYKSRGRQLPDNQQHSFEVDNHAVPSSIDWRRKGAVSSIKNQDSCGSCWAFSALGAVEGINQIKTGELLSLSPQELVDCSLGIDNHGCRGGIMEKAYEFVMLNGGISLEADYPYKGRQGICNPILARKIAASITGYVRIPERNETAMKAAVARQPIAVAIDASASEFQLYADGVFTGSCGKKLNHGVLLVGYGEDKGVGYWIVKNSWGIGWGNKGYMKLHRGSSDRSGVCGVAMEGSYPVKDF
ncbi:ervatamin-B-like [Salvia hispanica]|uniref:ervatamin-B-like n=1 Tax=Salvia hispanica TaxID=49212 RepID=UPI002009B748|nr:ervatamin-B-like [Salvia hispanica]